MQKSVKKFKDLKPEGLKNQVKRLRCQTISSGRTVNPFTQPDCVTALSIFDAYGPCPGR
jgi:hypothetical protein